MNRGIDGNMVIGTAGGASPFAVVAAILLGKELRKRMLRRQPPGSLTIQEVKTQLNADGLSLADKRELVSRFDGQRVRWPCTFCELTEGRWTTALCVREPHGGQFFFDPTRADTKRLERTPNGARMVVEGTVRVDISNNLLTLDAPVVRFDVHPSVGAT